MDLNNEGPEADPMDLDKEGRGFSYVHDLEWHLGVSPMKALAPAEPDQCQPASLVNLTIAPVQWCPAYSLTSDAGWH